MLTSGAVLLARLYCLGLAGWFVVWLAIGDAGPELWLINGLALYLFLPLPLALAVAALTRRRDLLLAVAGGIALWAYLWGALFLPSFSHDAASGPAMRVAAFNLLGFNLHVDAAIEAMLEMDADIIGFTELNPEIAAAIEEQLIDAYPHQRLDPQDGVRGSGVVSRLPFNQLDNAPLRHEGWVSQPRLLQLELESRSLTVVFVHVAATPQAYASRLVLSNMLAAYARDHDGPLVIAGDFNGTSTNEAYRVMTRELTDAWREAGWRFGHTFPGASKAFTPGSSRGDVLGVSVPRWLVRIDYVFHSEHFVTTGARTGSFGGSDHRPVIADLVLRN